MARVIATCNGIEVTFNTGDVNNNLTANVAITPVSASAASMGLTQGIPAPPAIGGQFAQQPKVTLKDNFGNICASDNTTVVTASKYDAGDWTLTGTVNVTVNAGVATFTNLGANNAAAVTGAQLAFNVTGGGGSEPQITSSPVNMLGPAGSPSNTTQPTNQTVTVGQTASFSVVATGDAPLSYQWKKGGTDIGGATSATLTINNVQISDTGSYTCFVSHAEGNVTSNAATLTVTAAAAESLITSSNVNVTVDNTAQTITYPMYTLNGTDFTQLANIKSVLAAATGYTYEIYQADGTTVAAAMDVTNVLKVSQGGNLVETYTFAANIKYGDVNGDGVLNTADLTLLTRYILNSTNYPFAKAYEIKAADINKDNVVNSSDKILQQRYLTNAQTYPISSPAEFLYNPLN